MISKSRLQKEKEEKVKDEESNTAPKEPDTSAASASDQPFVMPGDNALMKYVDEIQDKIAPLPTSRDQVVALAQLVFNV